jgi:hypothetical protein
MMSTRDKLLERLLSKPSDFEYDEAKTLLLKFGYKEDSRGHTSGSRVAFVNVETGHMISLHKPHPGKILKQYQIEQLIRKLRDTGVIQA